MITGLIGAFGGGTVGRMLGGRMGGMVGSMAGSMLARGGLGSMLGGVLGKKDDDHDVAAAHAPAMSDDDAMILLQAMCNAAKADGNVDEDEIQRIMGHIGDMDAQEEALLRSELTSPLDLDAFVRSVPSGHENDVYAASLLPITIDEPSEVEYLRNLASGLGISSDTVRAIHSELGID